MTTRTQPLSWLRDRAWWIGTAVVFALSGTFAAIFTTLGLRQFWRFHVHSFDLGIFAQGTWLLSMLKWPFFVTIRGLPLFADHSSYILVLVAPIYLVFPTPATLIVINVLALAFTAPLAFVVARRAGAGALLATTTGLLVLMQPALQWNVRDSFHPEVLVIPMVVAAIALLQRDRDVWAIVAVVIALTAKEDVGLLIAPLGLVIMWVMSKRRTGAIIAALGIGAFLVNFLILLPAWSPSGELLYSYRYEALGDGPSGVIIGLVTKPALWIEVFSDPLRLWYIAGLLFAMPLAVLAPRWLLAAVPTLLANVFTNHGYQYDIRYHYTAYLIAVVVIAAAFGAGRVQRWNRRGAVIAAVAVMILSAGITWAIAAPRHSWAQSHPHQDRIRLLVDMVPPDDSVSAWTTFAAHFTERDEIYLFPNPFTEHYYATPPSEYGAEGGDIPDPEAIEWVMVRFDSYDKYDELIADLSDSGEFEVAAVDPPFLLFHRITP